MGLYGRGPNPTKVDISGIAAVMRETLYQWMNCRIQIIDPKTGDNSKSADFNAATDTFSGPSVNPAILFDSGDDGAIVQPIRGASGVQFGDQAVSIQGIRFQTKQDISQLALRSGLHIWVLSGGEAPYMEDYVFSLAESLDSSFAWGRIMEATVVAQPGRRNSPEEVGFNRGFYGEGGYGR